MEKRAISVVDSGRSPLSTILWLSWPVFIEQILVALVQSVDTAMVGSLGAGATAAVSISQSPMMLINGVIMALGVGFTALIARCVGAGESERARELVRQSITTVVALGLPIAILCYALARKIPTWMGAAPDILDTATVYNQILAYSMMFRGLSMVLTAIYRGYGDTKTPMYINIGVNLVNVVGNYLLIYETRQITLFGASFTMFGAGWGVAGAAVSTSASAILGALILLVLTFVRKSPMRISLKESFRPNWEELVQVGRISLPAMFERFTMSGASVVVASTVAYLGTIAVAANSLSATAEAICFMPGFAFGTAATTLVGQSLGAKRPDLAQEYVRLSCRVGGIVMAVLSCMLFLFSNSIIGLFTPDAQVIAMGGVLLKILAVIQVPQVWALIFSGALRGAGDTTGPFIITLISMWGVRIVGAVVSVRLLHLGLTAVCVSMCADNVVRCVLFYLRYRKGNWKNA